MKIKTTDGILELKECKIQIIEENSDLLDVYKLLKSALLAIDVDKNSVKRNITNALNVLENMSL